MFIGCLGNCPCTLRGPDYSTVPRHHAPWCRSRYSLLSHPTMGETEKLTSLDRRRLPNLFLSGTWFWYLASFVEL